MKNLFFSVYFQIGVNIIGLPEIHEHKLRLVKKTYYRSFGNPLNIQGSKFF